MSWGKVPQSAAMDERLTGRDLRVLVYMAAAADGRTGVCRLKQGTIASGIRTDRVGVLRSIRQLIEFGYLSAIQPHGMRRSLQYRLLTEEAAAGQMSLFTPVDAPRNASHRTVRRGPQATSKESVEVAPRPQLDVASRATTDVASRATLIEQTSLNRIEPDGSNDARAEKPEKANGLPNDDATAAFRPREAVLAEFETWYRAYPHRVGKAAARKAYQAARKRGATATDLSAGVFRYVASKPPDRNWCNPSTFLNQERWLDEPAPPVTAGGTGTPRLKSVGQRVADAMGRIGRGEDAFHDDVVPKGKFTDHAAKRRRQYAEGRLADDDTSPKGRFTDAFEARRRQAREANGHPLDDEHPSWDVLELRANER